MGYCFNKNHGVVVGMKIPALLAIELNSIVIKIYPPFFFQSNLGLICTYQEVYQSGIELV